MKVYIAGPYTKGDVALNVRNAITAGQKVFKAGHFPYIPHMTHFWHMIFPGPYQQWIDIDLEWLPTCDVLIRLPGESSGADNEVKYAFEKKIRVFYGLHRFMNFIGGK